MSERQTGQAEEHFLLAVDFARGERCWFAGLHLQAAEVNAGLEFFGQDGFDEILEINVWINECSLPVLTLSPIETPPVDMTTSARSKADRSV